MVRSNFLTDYRSVGLTEVRISRPVQSGEDVAHPARSPLSLDTPQPLGSERWLPLGRQKRRQGTEVPMLDHPEQLPGLGVGDDRHVTVTASQRGLVGRAGPDNASCGGWPQAAGTRLVIASSNNLHASGRRWASATRASASWASPVARASWVASAIAWSGSRAALADGASSRAKGALLRSRVAGASPQVRLRLRFRWRPTHPEMPNRQPRKLAGSRTGSIERPPRQ